MSNDLQYRSFEIRASDLADNGEIRLLCSTDAAVNMGDYREILVHTPEAVEHGSCRSLLLNHDTDQIVGAVRSIEIRGGQMTATVFVVESARAASGATVRELVQAGALRGVSIGYNRDMTRAKYDDATRTLTVPHWSVREITLTPTPADTDAKVLRSLPTQFNTSTNASINNAAPAANQKGSHMADENKPQDKPADDKNEATRAAEIAAARERNAVNVKIVEVAESHGLRASPYLNKSLPEALEAMLADKARAEKTEVKADRAAAPVVEVVADKMDKANEFAEKGILEGRSVLEIARRHASVAGLPAHEMNRSDLAGYILGKKVPGMSMRSAANVTSGMFTNVVLANYMDKAIFNGFNNFASSVTYPIWTRRRIASDFKTFASGALDSGNLVETAENIAFPELTKSEGSYTDSVGLWGATLSLTYQALVNDDLGEFTNMLGRVGAIAQRTIDKEVYAVVNAATWTDNTNSVTGLATAGDLDTVRKSFEKKTGPSGEIMGNLPKFLLVPSCLRTAALQATTQVQGSTEMKTHGDLIPVITPHLTEDGTPAQSKFYLAGDPTLVDTVLVSFLAGAETPQVMEYDAGATAARKWKVMQAFVATLASTTVSSVVYIPGMQQGA